MNTGPFAFLPQASQFPPSSRYHDIEIAQFIAADGRSIPYLRRRLLPPPEHFATLFEHHLVEGERLDHLAATYLGDPDQFWRICDANGAFIPSELTDTPGRSLRITLPEGFAASGPDA